MTATVSAPIAVAVVSWNTRELLLDCLAALRADAEAGRAEVWVVDNGSRDGSPAAVRAEHPWVTLVEPGENLGFGPAVNLVASLTSSPWLVAANADVTVEPVTLERLRTLAASREDIGMVGPRLLLLDGSTQVSVQPYPGLTTNLLYATHAARISDRVARALRAPGHWEPPSAAAVPWVTGAFVLMSRRAFDDAGGFDPRQWLYAEDLDLCWRMQRRGWDCWYEPAAVAHHAHSAASTQLFDERSFALHMHAAMYLWMLRRRGALYTRSTALVGMLDGALRLLALRLLSTRDGRPSEARIAQARGAIRRHRLGLRSAARLADAVRRRDEPA